MANNQRQGLYEGDPTETRSKTLTISDKTGTDAYATKPFESRMWAPEYVVLPGAEEEGNITDHSANAKQRQYDLGRN